MSEGAASLYAVPERGNTAAPSAARTVMLVARADLSFVLRQTPAGDGRWGGMRLVTDAGTPHDWLLVIDGPPDGLETRVPRERRIALLEPPDVRRYPRAFLDQFGGVMGPVAPAGFSGALVGSQPCLPWFYGVGVGGGGKAGAAERDWAALAAGPCDETAARPGLVSAVTSTKRVTVNQVRRLRFLDMLRAELGEDLAVFGRGFRPIGDKAEGIDRFRYHVVLENNLAPGLWTEKLADPILGGAFPIFAGGPGLSRWFDPRGFAEIDITRPRRAVAEVRDLLRRDPVADPATRAAMAENRRRLMEEHQLFPVLAAHVAANAGQGPPPLERALPVRPAARTLAARIDRASRPLRLALARAAIAARERG